MQCLGYRIQPCQELEINAKTVELVGRMLGISNYTTGRVSTETCLEVKQRREEKGVWSGRLGTSEGGGEYARYQHRETSTNLGGIV